MKLLARASEIYATDAATELRRVASRGPYRLRRPLAIVRLRRAHEAHRDARLVFRAAAEGRPLELQRRLVLGKLAGGLDRLGEMNGVLMKPLDAAKLACHDDCIRVLHDRKM